MVAVGHCGPKTLPRRKPREVPGRAASRSGFWFLKTLLNVPHLAPLLFSWVSKCQFQGNRKTLILPSPSRVLSALGCLEREVWSCAGLLRGLGELPAEGL